MKRLLAFLLAFLASVAGAQVNPLAIVSPRYNSANQQLVTITGVIATYGVGGTFVPASGVLFAVCGSATKTVVLRSLQISGTATTVGTLVMNLIKTSTAPTGGTPVSVPATSYDSNDAAPTATATAYTAAPTAGTAIGTFAAFSESFLTAGGGQATSQVPGVITVPQGSKPIILRGTGQCVELSTPSVALSGGSISVSASWTEEPFFPTSP